MSRIALHRLPGSAVSRQTAADSPRLLFAVRRRPSGARRNKLPLLCCFWGNASYIPTYIHSEWELGLQMGVRITVCMCGVRITAP
ncbi:hypothetical protein L209DRAFT_759817 [Thermothelomyces heterothallicus CBS 203.75]